MLAIRYRQIWKVLPLLFFGVLLALRAAHPDTMVFDEIHYVPAAKALILFQDDLNWVHPPLGKLIMGAGWYVLHEATGLVPEPLVFRLIAIAFGLWALWAVRAWMLALGYSERLAQAALWLTGFNFLWFVQAKTAMLDIFFIAFALWGALDIYKGKRFWRGCVLLGLAGAVKWSVLPIALIALVFNNRRWSDRAKGIVVSVVAYVLCYVPLAFLAKNAVPYTGIIAYHQKMLRGFDSINSANHPYISHWWQWPTLIRPMWYAFESSGNVQHCIWAGGNPAIYWLALPLSLWIVYVALVKRQKSALIIAAMYWIPTLFWAVAPRKLQLYYYFLPSSFWLAPIIVWAYDRVSDRAALKETRGWLVLGYVLLSAALFFYFLPIMDGRALPAGRYLNYMWLRSWI